MASGSTLSFAIPHEDWADTDFDIPEGTPLNTHSDAESDNEAEDWDMEMALGRTGGVKLSLLSMQSINIQPPISSLESPDDDDDCDDEGASTIKLSNIPTTPSQTTPQQSHPLLVDDDIENAFELPAELSRLSLRPLHHRLSKTSLEWGDRDHTSSSTSSDAYTSFGFGPSASPSSNSTAPSTAGDLETDIEDDDDEGELDGLVLPDGLFDSSNSGVRLAKILESKEKVPRDEDRPKPPHFDSEEDFEMGLIIDDDLELSPSRLPSNRVQTAEEKVVNRSKSAPPRPPVAPFRPSSRVGITKERSKSPTFPPSASMRTMRPQTLSPTSIKRPTLTRKSTFQTISTALQSMTSTSANSGPLRGQKSQCVLKPPSPRSNLIRKGSLSSLIDIAAAVAGPSTAPVQSPTSYAAATISSRARKPISQTTHRQAQAPTMRPSTPNGTPVGLRLTMPTTSSRAKIRPAISSVFGNVSKDKEDRTSPVHLPTSRPSSIASSSSLRSHTTTSIPKPAAPKVLRRPKRTRTYGDGTELDGIEDLPIDRERESQYRVVPRGSGGPRLGTNSKKSSPEKEKSTTSEKENKGTINRRGGKLIEPELKPTSTTSTLRRKDRIDLGATLRPVNDSTPQQQTRIVSRKKLPPQTPSNLPLPVTRRKPTLIRNLGGHTAPKVIGDMKWNPQTLRWEGNEHALRDFDAVTSSSTRPALITHLTGSSIGSPVGVGSLAAAGARIVGNMVFDPTRMCWISRLPPEEDEPDVFAGLDDDDEEWESKGGTIRANAQAPLEENAISRGETPSPRRPQSQAHSRAMSESGSERGARPTLHSLQDIDGKLLKKCRDAEIRHRVEMKGWRLPKSEISGPDMNALFEIRALATRQY
ncbi:hypothetical protein Clacol_008159 [Clathrus columnatus]|uniref:Uncharacterized protein n=1 Tax=Clathrus columnatus TaxID=1419009 RepID=A0AAV5AJP8_9AGAM|nr:hypothetical protein Clacol_008159 [Clathrus columnatus]